MKSKIKLLDSEKNILVLGDKGCGKHKFVLRYRDREFYKNDIFSEDQKISYKKKHTNGSGSTTLNFIFDISNEGFISSNNYKNIQFDLILVLVDLSSKDADTQLKKYTLKAEQHYSGVNLILIGTKSDQRLKQNKMDHLIISSALNGVGFDRFEKELQAHLNPVDENKKSKSCSLF